MENKLKVWWIPQVPGKRFEVPVADVVSGALLLRVLAEYDLFQLEHNIKPDYCNAGGLAMFEDGEWVDWYDEKTGEDDPEAFCRARQIKEANEQYPIGTKVRYYPIYDEDEYREEVVRSQAWDLGHGEVVIKITGHTGCVCVSRLKRQEGTSND